MVGISGSGCRAIESMVTGFMELTSVAANFTASTNVNITNIATVTKTREEPD